MSEIEIAVKGAKEIEAFLVTHFKAQGRGLHEKLTSVENHIPPQLRKQIRFVASVRNAVVHEEGDNIMRNPVAYQATVAKILHELRGIHQHPTKRSRSSASQQTSGKSAQPILDFVCFRQLVPWLLMLGSVAGFFVCSKNGYGITLSSLLGILSGAVLASLSRIILYLSILGVLIFILFVSYYLVTT
jgi:hypothetical protein